MILPRWSSKEMKGVKFTDQKLGHVTIPASRAGVECISFYGTWGVLVDFVINSDWKKACISAVHRYFDGGNYLGGIFGEFLSAFAARSFQGLAMGACMSTVGCPTLSGLPGTILMPKRSS
jgi:hypothetical protein